MMNRIGILLVVMGMGAALVAVEYPLREQPLGSELVKVKGKTVEMVDWGRVSESMQRDPRECDRQRQALHDFVASDAFYEWFRKNAIRTAKIALWSGSKELDRIDEYVRTKGHATALRRRDQARQRQVAVSSELATAPYEQRERLQLVFYDDRDDEQRRWLQRWFKQRDSAYVPVVVAVGWRNLASLRQFSESSKIPISPFPTDDYPGGYGVTELPAVVHFPDARTVAIAEGLIPAQPDSASVNPSNETFEPKK